jgi:hypothetical protein
MASSLSRPARRWQRWLGYGLVGYALVILGRVATNLVTNVPQSAIREDPWSTVRAFSIIAALPVALAVVGLVLVVRNPKSREPQPYPEGAMAEHRRLSWRVRVLIAVGLVALILVAYQAFMGIP